MELSVSIISGAAIVLAALLPALVVYRRQKLVAENEYLRRKLRLAIADIEFLLYVEQLADEEWKATFDASSKRELRANAQCDGLVWSGEFTAARAARLKAKL